MKDTTMTEKTLRDELAMLPIDRMEFGSVANMAAFLGEELPDNDLEVIEMSLRAEAKIRYERADAMMEYRAR